MKQSWFKEEQITEILCEQEAGVATAEVCHSQCVSARILWARFRRISAAHIGPRRFYHSRNVS
jgi:hypothetical protein